MRYWWVNQNQTYRHEVQVGYLWSPKRNANGARNPFYESMREVAPGDLIFSFIDTRILAIGIAQSYCWESPKPRPKQVHVVAAGLLADARHQDTADD
jgi:putative restriction endonuclease